MLVHADRSGQHLGRWIGLTEDIVSLASAEAWCAAAMGNWADRRRFDLLAFSREDGRLVGGGSIPRVRWEVPAVEIGWWLDVAATGRGYATEIGGALVRCAGEGWRAPRLSVWCDVGNAPSIRVAERLGFRPEGIVRGQVRGGSGAAADFWTASLISGDLADIGDRLPVTDALGA
jgi:RimJ/RimL family protein N-acetyltransferase